jgi:hypothetical protein
MVNESSKIEFSQKRALVISCYDWEWQSALALEGSIELISEKLKVDFIDLSLFNTSFVKHALKSLTKKTISYRKKRRCLRAYQIEYHRPIVRILISKFNFRRLLFLNNIYGNRFNNRWQIIYPGLVDLTNNTHIQESNSEFKNLIHRAQVEDVVFTSLLSKWYKRKGPYDQSLIVNGRFPLNRAAEDFFKAKGMTNHFIEFASQRDKFQIFTVSPHSIKNRRELFQEFIRNSTDSIEVIKEIGSEFFEKRKTFDEQANLKWTRRMQPNEIPEISQNQKVCTFYSTSEKEFAGVRDIAIEGCFQDQFEAFNGLIESLGKDWLIFLRRHPKAFDQQRDFEDELWDSFKLHTNVRFIQPESSVDSYSLGMRSDLVAHFGSLIGPELIYAGHPNVVSLGNTAWEDLDPSRHVHSRDSLLRYLKFNFGKPSIVDITYYGYFMAKFGKSFKLLKWDNGKGRWELRE